jgi:hypothetical protein
LTTSAITHPNEVAKEDGIGGKSGATTDHNTTLIQKATVTRSRTDTKVSDIAGTFNAMGVMRAKISPKL